MPPLHKKTCIVIAGPTAVGKTGIAIALAQHFNTEIISADSRQCYRELNIGVAKPSLDQLRLVNHYFINTHAVTENVNAGLFEQYALTAVTKIFLEHDMAIVAGGTGLYIRAFCEGMDPIPAAPPALRNEIAIQYQHGGLQWLQKTLQQEDAAWYAIGEIQNPQRMMRALEVKLATGHSILDFQKIKKYNKDFNIIKIGLTLPKEQLYSRINARVDEMIANGLEDEVRSLLPYRQLNALQTVGYREMFDYFDSGDKQLTIDNIKKNTRHYAKRQLTWFNRDPDMLWFSAVDYGQVISALANLV